MAAFLDQTKTWAGGLVTSAEADRLPKDAYPYARNTALYSAADGQAIPGKRLGMGQMHNTTVFTGGQVTGQVEFRQVSGGSVNKQHVCTTLGGNIAVVDTNGNFTEVSGWTPTLSYPDMKSANNRLFMVDGTSAKKWTGSALQNFGIVRPIDTDWTLSTGISVGTMPPDSEYHVAITYYNSSTGHESSRSIDKSVATANDGNSVHALTVTLNTPTDTQVDKIRIYIRKVGLGSTFTQTAEVASNIGGYTVDVTDTQINNQILKAPGLSSNDPPPTGIRYLALHEGRLFVSDGSDIFYSDINKPEAFSTLRSIAAVSRDGQAVTGLAAVKDQLLIFKQDSIWAVFGSDPQTWQVRLVVPDIGCVSHRSIVVVEGTVFFWSEQGPYSWDVGGRPDPIGKRFVSPTVHSSAVNFTNHQAICAAVELVDQKVHFAYPSASSTRADLILTFNYRVGGFEAINDPMDVASMATVSDGADRPWVFIGSYNGLLFKCGVNNYDGLPAGATHSGTFTAATTQHTSITLGSVLPAASTLPTTNGGVVERKITVVDSLGRPVSSSRARITANTAGALTVEPAIGQLTVGEVYTVYIASPDWQLDTHWYDADMPFVRKRYEWLYLGLRSASATTFAAIDLFTDFSSTAAFARALSAQGVVTDVTWQDALWTDATWAGISAAPARRLRIGLPGQVVKARFRNHVPNQAIALTHTGIRGEILRDKR
jgi:hypothetical protein